MECKFQTLTYSTSGTLYLLKLFNHKIEVISFKNTGEMYEHQSTKEIEIEKGDWDYLNCQALDSAKKALLIVFGKVTPFDETKEVNL